MKPLLWILSIALLHTPQLQARKTYHAPQTQAASCVLINLPEFPNSFNPSIIKTEKGFLLSFRYTDPENAYCSHLGVVLLNESLEPTSQPQLLDTRWENPIPSHSEDARLFEYRGEIYLIYNDNTELMEADWRQPRQLYIAKLHCTDGRFSLERPVQLFHRDHYKTRLIEKNWTPFVWRDRLLLSYTLSPHEVLEANLETGECCPIAQTNHNAHWKWGALRGGTPAKWVDGEYLGLFHSRIGRSLPPKINHYYIGAYGFSAEPPFEMVRMSASPIVVDGFYGAASETKRIIYPGGLAINDGSVYIAYGKNDCEIWIVKMSKEALVANLVPVECR